MLKKISLILISILLLSFLIGPGIAQRKVVITFWNGFTGPDRVIVEYLVKQFNEKNPDLEIKMDIMPWDTLRNKLLPSMLISNEPDFVALDPHYIPQYVKAGVLASIDDIFSEDFKLEIFPKNLINIAKYQDKIYGLPMSFFNLMLYYNKDLFKAAKLDPNKPPKNWTEWRRAILATTVDKDKDGKPEQYGIAIPEYECPNNWIILIWGYGGDIISPDKTKSMLDHPRTIAAVKYWSDLIIKYKISPVGISGPESDKLFETQKAAMQITGPWMTSGYAKAGLNFDVAPIPEGPAGKVTLGDSVTFMVNKKTTNKEAIYRFIKFWNSKESQIYWALNTGFPPNRVDIDISRLEENPFVVKFASVSQYAKFYLAGIEEFAKIDNDIFVPTIQKITRGLETPEKALKEAAKKINEILQKKK